MGYPDYPNNRLIVNGVDLTTEFKMVLLDGYTLTPPSPKTYTVDIPGGNGKLDLTESVYGDTTYDNRRQSFTFAVINVADFERVKTQVSNFLHGREFDYQMTMDPGYTYHGRFSVIEYSHNKYMNGIVGNINIEIDAKPFKLREEQVYVSNAVGGNIINLQSGRMRVRPVIETDSFTRVIYNNTLINLPQGSWTINDLLLTKGSNELYLNSYAIHNLKWKDLKTNAVTWGQFKQNRLFEWYKSKGDGTYINMTWANIEGKTWNDMVDVKWGDQMFQPDATSKVKNVYIKYDWGDL